MAKAKAKPAPEPEDDDEDDDDVEAAPRRWLVWIRRVAWLRRGAYVLTTLLFGTGTAGWYLPDLPVAGPLAQQVRARIWTSSKAEPKKGDAKAASKDKKGDAGKSEVKPAKGADRSAAAAPTAHDLADTSTSLPESPVAATEQDASLPVASEPLSQPTPPTFEEEPAVALPVDAATEPAVTEAASAESLESTPTIEADVDPSLSQALGRRSANARGSNSLTTASSNEAASRSPSVAGEQASSPANGTGRRSRWAKSAPDTETAPELEAQASDAPAPTTAHSSAASAQRQPAPPSQEAYEASPPVDAARSESSRQVAVQPTMGQGRATALPASPPASPAMSSSAPSNSATPISRESSGVGPSARMARGAMTQATSASPTTAASPASAPRGGANGSAASRPDETVSIATFNIQVFGTAKLDNPDVTDKLVEIIRQFDVVAIQEIRSKEDDVLPRFVRLINSTGRQYEFVIGPRLGRTSSKEQYAFVYDTQRIEINRPSVGTIEDPSDLLHREPLIARFRSRLVPADRAFTFYLANIHTDPDDVETEVDVLADVFEIMQQTPSGEDDIILLGDFNTDHKRLGRLGQRPNLFAVVEDTPTNARQNEAYDNILFDRQATSEFTGRWAVLDVQSWFRLSREEMLSISDHLPVWATFSAWESTSPSAVSNRGVRRSR